MSTFAVAGCSELVPLEGTARTRIGAVVPQVGVIRDGAMLVRDGRIGWVGPRRELDPKVEVIDAGGRVVMPGFVDAHTHPVFAGNRADEFEKRSEGATYQEIAAAGGGLRFTVLRTRAASGDELLSAASPYSQLFLRHGTT